MNPNPRIRLLAALALCVCATLSGATLRAQEEAEEESGKPIGSFWFEVQGWFSQPVGLNFSPATQNETILTVTDDNQIVTVFSSNVLSMDAGTSEELRFRLVWELPHKSGDLAITYYSHDDLFRLSDFTPGVFGFVETLTDANAFAGFKNDGLADGFISSAGSRLRDERIDYSRQAFRSSRFSANWSVGWRRVDHDRRITASYFAVLPDLPALIPPIIDCPNGNCPNLDPSEDVASSRSTYEGRGPTIGIDMELPLWKNKVVVEAGLGVSALRGKVKAGYEAVNRVYVLELGGEAPPGFPQEAAILLPEGYDLFDDSFLNNDTPPKEKFFKDFIREVDVAYGLQSNSIDSSSDVIDAHIGVRWRARKWLEFMLGVRNTRYTNVAVELRPEVAAPFLDIQIDQVNQVERSVSLEGFYTGAIIRLY